MCPDPGFSISPHVLAPAECESLLATLSVLVRSRAGARHLMSEPSVRALASDPRLLTIAAAQLRAPAVPFRATLFAKSAGKNWLIPWHQDTALPLAARFDASGWGPWSEKSGMPYAHAPAWALSRVIALRLHLDDSALDNGPLRVIPDSHRSGVLTDTEVLACVHSADPVDCLAPRGGVIAMRPLLIHASSKARTSGPRRVLHIEYADALALAPGIRLAIA